MMWRHCGRVVVQRPLVDMPNSGYALFAPVSTIFMRLIVPQAPPALRLLDHNQSRTDGISVAYTFGFITRNVIYENYCKHKPGPRQPGL